MNLRHAVRVVVVVDERGVFVRTGHRIDAEGAAAARIEMADLQPDARRFHQNFRAHLGEKGAVAARFGVKSHGESHRRVDVILRGTARIVRRTFVAADGAPRIQRAARMIHFARMRTCAIEHAIAPDQARLHQLRRGETEYRQHEGFRIPEDMAFVTFARHTFRGDAAGAVAIGGLEQMEQVQTQRLFVATRLLAAFDGDDGIVPETRVVVGLDFEQRIRAGGHRRIERDARRSIQISITHGGLRQRPRVDDVFLDGDGAAAFHLGREHLPHAARLDAFAGEAQRRAGDDPARTPH